MVQTIAGTGQSFANIIIQRRQDNCQQPGKRRNNKIRQLYAKQILPFTKDNWMKK